MKKWICFIWISTVLASQQPRQDCHHSCYRFVESEQPWHSALQYCQHNSMKLAQIEDAEEFQFIRDTLKRHYNIKAQQILEFWIDGYYNDTRRQWVWSSRNGNINFFSWASGEPNGIDHCIGLFNHEDFYMNDDKCEVARAYICEDESQTSTCTDSDLPPTELRQAVCHV